MTKRLGAGWDVKDFTVAYWLLFSWGCAAKYEGSH
jgi:hypothetical protein